MPVSPPRKGGEGIDTERSVGALYVVDVFSSNVGELSAQIDEFGCVSSDSVWVLVSVSSSVVSFHHGAC